MWEHTRGKTLTDAGRLQDEDAEDADRSESADCGHEVSGGTREQAGLDRWAGGEGDI